MTGVVTHRLQHPVLVVAAEADDRRRHLTREGENRVDAALRIGTSIDVIPERHYRIAAGDFRPKLVKEIRQRSKVSVDVANRYRCHRAPETRALRTVAVSIRRTVRPQS